MVVSGIAAWLSAILGAKYAIKNHDTKLDGHEKRIEKLEGKMEKTVTLASCRLLKADCHADRLLEDTDVKTRLDTIMTMFSELEERRNKRWADYEVRREEQKDALQVTLNKLTRQVACLEAVIQNRAKSFRIENGDKDE